MLSREFSSKFTSEYSVDYLSIKMILNEKHMNYKVVAFDKTTISYNFYLHPNLYERNMIF
jgi:hypothetical protein